MISLTGTAVLGEEILKTPTFNLGRTYSIYRLRSTAPAPCCLFGYSRFTHFRALGPNFLMIKLQNKINIPDF